jgi:hypothetical protein
MNIKKMNSNENTTNQHMLGKNYDNNGIKMYAKEK